MSTIDKETFCHEHCQEKISLEKDACKVNSNFLKQKQLKLNEENEKQKNKILNTEGLLIYYRKFVHTFLDHLSQEVIYKMFSIQNW